MNGSVVFGLRDVEGRLSPANPQLARLISRIPIRRYQAFLIDHWNRTETLPPDFGMVFRPGPLVNPAWHRRAA